MILLAHFCLLALAFIPWSGCEELQLLESVSDVRRSKEHAGGGVIYFVGNEDTVDKDLLKRLGKAAEDLDAYNVHIGYFHCGQDGAFISECSGGSSVFAYSRGDSQTLYMPSLHSVDAIVAHVLQHLLRFEVSFAQSNDDWDLIVRFARRTTDVVLLFVKGLGDRSHRLFLETAFVYGSKYKFVISTEIGMKALDGVYATTLAGVWYYFCEEATEKDPTCTHQMFNGVPKNVLNLANFIEFSGLPDVVTMRRNGTSLFDTVDARFPVQRVVCFTPDRAAGEHLAKRLKLVAKKTRNAYRFIVGNPMNNTVEDIKKYGISPNMLLPHCVMESGVLDEDTKAMHYEHLPSAGKPFVYKEVLDFVQSFQDNSEAATFEIAKGIVEYLKYTKKDEMNEDNRKNTVVTICNTIDPDCLKFKAMVMRLARTFQLNNVDNLAVHYMDFTEDENVDRTTSDSQDTESLLESVQLIPAGGNEGDMLLYHGSPDYESTLAFICQHFEIEDVHPVPPSGSDYQFTALFEDFDNTLGMNLDRDGEEEEGEDEGEPEDLFKDQEDEVARDMFLKHRNIKDSNVEALTDKTFPLMKEKYDVLIVHYYLPWDSRCLAFFEPFAKVAQIIHDEAPASPTVGLFKVSCYNWPDVCVASNVSAYPEVAIFRKGQPKRLYLGPLEEDHFAKAVRLYQVVDPVTALHFDSDVSLFEKAMSPMPAAAFASISIMGLFKSEDDKELAHFKDVASEMQGSYIFGYASGKLALASAEKYHTSLPAGVIIKHHSAGDAAIVQLTDASVLKDQLKVKSLPVFGKLTYFNLPEYRSAGQKLVILFVTDDLQENTIHFHAVKDLARLHEWSSVSFVFMTLADVEGRPLKEEYLGDKNVPAIVYVDHEKGAVYEFDNQVSHRMLVDWVTECQANRPKPIYTMKDESWLPLKDGFDFIKLASMPSESDGETEAEQHQDEQAHHGTKPRRRYPKSTKEPSESGDSAPKHEEL